MPNWKKVIVSGSDAALNSLNVTAQFTASGLNYPPTDGTVGQVIITDGAGNLSFSPVENTAIVIKNVSGVTIAKGTPCYITGSGTSGNIAGVFAADAANPARMPAGVIAGETLIAGAEGVGLINGYIGNVNTAAFAAGDSIYVAVGGGYTNVRPTGSAVLIQKLGNVEKSHASNGSGVINGPAYYNEVPNIQQGFTWVGNSNGVAIPTATSSIQNVVSSSFASTASFVNPLRQTVIVTGSLAVTGSQTITNGSLLVYAPSAGNGVTAYVGSSGMTITGNNGSGNPGISSTSGIIHISSTINGTGGSEVLNVNRSANGAYIQAWRSFAGTALSLVDSSGNFAIRRTTATASLDVAGTTRISGSFNTAASGSILTVIGSGSAQPIFTVQGSQGELFSITDSLSGSLFSVNDISGLPVLEALSDNTVLIGNYQDPMLITTTKLVTTASGQFTLYALPTASYDTAFFEYSIQSGSNARAGSIMAIQSGTSVNFTETTTTDFGSTSGFGLTVQVAGANMILTGSATTSGWTIKTIVRSI